MQYAVMLNAENRIVATSADYNIGAEQIDFELPNDFDFANQRDYKIEDGKLKHDPVSELASEPTLAERSRADIDYLAMMTGVEL